MGTLEKFFEEILAATSEYYSEAISFPMETAGVFRRGTPHAVVRRYQTLEDLIYKKLLEKQELSQELERSGLSTADGMRLNLTGKKLQTK